MRILRIKNLILIIGCFSHRLYGYFKLDDTIIQTVLLLGWIDIVAKFRVIIQETQVGAIDV